MIREVIGLGTELEASFPEDRECLNQRDIPVHQAGRVNIVANAMLKIKRPERRRSPDGISAIGRGEPLSAATTTSRAGKFAKMLHPSMLHPELAHGSCYWNIGRFAVEAASLSDSGVIIDDPDGTGKAGLQLSVAANLPTARHLAYQSVLSLKEGHHIEVVRDEDLTHIVLRRPPEIGCVVGIGDDCMVIGTVIHVLGPGVGSAECGAIAELPIPSGLQRVVSLAYTALRLLNEGETLIWPEIVRVDARIVGQRAGRGLVDVKDIPIMQAAGPHIGDRH